VEVTIRALLIVLIVALSVRTAAAQPESEPTRARPWDVAIMVAAVAGHQPLQTERDFGDDWFNTGALAIVTGRHITPHLKLEVDFSATGEGRRWIEKTVNVPGYPSPIFYGAEHSTRVRSVAGSLVYQFFENQWAHPFVQVGAAIDADRDFERTVRQTFYPPRPDIPIVLSDNGEGARETTVRARLLVGGGAKLYVTPRVFFRTDGRAALDDSLRHLSLRAGFGVDF